MLLKSGINATILEVTISNEFMFDFAREQHHNTRQIVFADIYFHPLWQKCIHLRLQIMTNKTKLGILANVKIYCNWGLI